MWLMWAWSAKSPQKRAFKVKSKNSTQPDLTLISLKPFLYPSGKTDGPENEVWLRFYTPLFCSLRIKRDWSLLSLVGPAGQVSWDWCAALMLSGMKKLCTVPKVGGHHPSAFQEASYALQAGSQALQEVLTVWSVIKRKVLTRTYSYPLWSPRGSFNWLIWTAQTTNEDLVSSLSTTL